MTSRSKLSFVVKSLEGVLLGCVVLCSGDGLGCVGMVRYCCSAAGWQLGGTPGRGECVVSICPECSNPSEALNSQMRSLMCLFPSPVNDFF